MQIFKMKLIKRVSLFLFLILVCLCITTFLKKLKEDIDTSESRYHYMPNDTHCPIAYFDEKLKVQYENAQPCKHKSNFPVYVINNFAFYNKTILETDVNLVCFYKIVLFKTDFESTLSTSWEILFDKTFLGAEIFLVRCKGGSLFDYHQQYLFGYGYKERKSESGHFKDILIIGIDSVARMAWKRLLTKSYEYLENEMVDNSVIFKKVNVLGDGTTINVLGLLAGELETEVYESRRGFAGAKFIDEYSWIWKELKSKHYSTYYDEDDVDFGTFQYRLLGFRTQPTDFYGRTWRLLHNIEKHSSLCVNHRNLFEDQLYNVRSFFETVQSRKFAFVWSTFFSHNTNEDVTALDTTVTDFLKEVNKPESVFNNTMFVLMSDHGHRFNSRLHLQGKFEERLPFLALILPKKIVKKRPEIMHNMKRNENKLVTTMDVYESMKDMLNNFTYTVNNQSKFHKMSLFYPDIPYRQCENVKIAPHWCSCLQWTEIGTTEKVVQEAATYLVNTINEYTEEYRVKCHLLKLGRVIRSHLIAPSEEVLKFHDSDQHGRVPNMGVETKLDSLYYRIAIETTPGDAVFESTISENINNEKKKRMFYVDMRSVDRSNRYSGWIWCIKGGMKDVRKFCLCK